MGLAVALDLRGLVEPLPLRALSAYSRSSLLLKDSIIGNMRPFERLPLCAIASTLPPVFSSNASIHFQRSRGLSLPGG